MSDSAPPASITEQLAQIVRALRDQPGRAGYTFDELGRLIGSPVGENNELLASIEANPQTASSTP